MSRSHPDAFLPCVSLLAFAWAAAPAAAVVLLPDGFADQQAASGLREPIGLAFLPDGRIFVVEQTTGNIWIVVPQTGAKGVAVTVPDISTGSERGLLGIAVDPGWPARPWVYVHLTHASGSVRIRRYIASGALTDPGSRAITLDDPYGLIADIPDSSELHNGGTLRFGPDGMLYASVGDDHQVCEAQQLSSSRGKILRMTVAALPDTGGGVAPKALITPADNPFPGPNEIERLVYAKGLRNPFRFQIDPSTGILYIADVGELGWEELDESHGAEDFGWPMNEGMHPFPPGQVCGGPQGTDPIWEYDRSGFSAAIIAGPRYRPAGGPFDFPPEYDGDLFVLDFYQGFLRRLEYRTDSGSWDLAAPVPGQPTPVDWGTGLVSAADFALGPDGAIYYVTRASAEVRRIVRSTPASVAETLEPAVDISPIPLDAASGGRLRLTLPVGGPVELALFDVTGRSSRVIFAGTREAGVQEFALKASPGIHFARVRYPGGTIVRKIVVAP